MTPSTPRPIPSARASEGDLAAAAVWPDDSPAAEARSGWRTTAPSSRRLNAVPPSALAGEDALNRELLARQLDLDIQGSSL